VLVAAIVYQTSRQTGITYAYESLSYWDKEKRQSRAKRKCIGRVDPETKEIIFPKWAATHKHPYGKNIPSQRSSELGLRICCFCESFTPRFPDQQKNLFS
jgi:hypothetical protein